MEIHHPTLRLRDQMMTNVQLGLLIAVATGFNLVLGLWITYLQFVLIKKKMILADKKLRLVSIKEDRLEQELLEHAGTGPGAHLPAETVGDRQAA